MSFFKDPIREIIEVLKTVPNKRYQEAAKLGELCLAPCENNTDGKGECVEQGLTLENMCPTCKQYWIDSCNFVGDDVNETIARFQKEITDENAKLN